ncbi:MAG TPA: hypothetical protein VFW40_12275, partial [Capsulimonadaceae bacterium]|nr:hypothetical protein [Capsulimonadaceae bacterium]
LMHTIGRWMGKARAMADQFRKSFDEMARQAELDELRSEIDALRRERPFAGLDQTLGSPVLPDVAPKPEGAVGYAEPAGHEAAPEEALPQEPIAPGAEPPPP